MPNEQTFTSYDAKQGAAYMVRFDYHSDVYKTVIDKHVSSGGELGTVLDVGCGPGLATKTLAQRFDHAIGLDPSLGMLEIARGRSLTTRSGEMVSFEQSGAEELGSNLSPPVADESIDLITAANAAHWFDLPAFYSAAQRVLKPSGTIIFWTSGEIRAHPDMPAAQELDEIIDKTHAEMQPYMNEGNLLTWNRYRTLPLSEDFTVERYEWPVERPFFTGPQEIDFDTFEKMRGTSSFVTRWRQANPESTGEKDTVRILRRQMEAVLHRAGVKPGEERLKGAVHGVLLIMKKR